MSSASPSSRSATARSVSARVRWSASGACEEASYRRPESASPSCPAMPVKLTVLLVGTRTILPWAGGNRGRPDGPRRLRGRPRLAALRRAARARTAALERRGRAAARLLVTDPARGRRARPARREHLLLRAGWGEPRGAGRRPAGG